MPLGYARRKYNDTINGSDAHKMVEMIATLYRLEKNTVGLEGAKKLAMRKELIGPWLTEFKAQATTLSDLYLKKGMMQKALYYTLNN